MRAVKSVGMVTRYWVVRAFPLLVLALAGCVSYRTRRPTRRFRRAIGNIWRWRQESMSIRNSVAISVEDPTGQPPGTIIVDTKTHFLYYVLPKKKAIRYGIATGSGAYGWTGVATVGRKEEWPHWMPPSDMVERWPHLQPTAAAGGLPGRSGKSARCARALSLPGR